jgi:hypothetical protein
LKRSGSRWGMCCGRSDPAGECDVRRASRCGAATEALRSNLRHPDVSTGDSPTQPGTPAVFEDMRVLPSQAESVLTAGVDTERHIRRPGAWAWGICWLMFASTVLNYMDRQAIALVGPQVKSQFALDNVGFGWVLAAFQLS